MRNGLVGGGVGVGGSRLTDYGNGVIRARVVKEGKDRIGGGGKGSSYLGVREVLRQKEVNAQVMNWLSV